MEYNFIRFLDHDYWNNTFSQNLEDFRTRLTFSRITFLSLKIPQAIPQIYKNSN